MFSENLKIARKRKDYTLEQLANEYNKRFGGGLSKGTLSKYENGKQEPMITVVINLAEILDVSIDFLTNICFNNNVCNELSADFSTNFSAIFIIQYKFNLFQPSFYPKEGVLRL